MKKLLKYLGISLGIIVLLLVAAVVILPMVIDPNDYRGKITEVVKAQTGRELTIEGDIKLSVFPWLGLELGKMELSNAQGFGPEPFARLQGVEVSIKLLPLLKKSVEMDTVTLQGLEAYLGRNQDGISNWDDLIAAPKAAEKTPEAPAQEAPSDPAQMLAALAIGGIEISDARVVWDDRSTNQRFEVSKLNLNTDALSLSAPFNVKLSLDLNSSNPAINGHLQLASAVGLDLPRQRYQLSGLKLSVDAQGDIIPGGKLSAQLNGDISTDLAQQTLALQNLKVTSLGTELTAAIDISQLMAQPDVKGALQFAIRDIAPLMQAFADQLPSELNLAALKGSTLNTEFALALDKQTLSLPQLTLSALDTQLTATLEGKRLMDTPRFTGTLALAEFVPQDLIGQLGIALPPMADPSALSKASLNTNFNAGLDHVALKKLRLRFDDSTLSGSLSVKQFATPVIRYSLALNEIDVDRYLPPPAPDAAPAPATPASAATTAALELPLELLRSLNINGGIKLGKLKVMNLHSRDIHATLKANKGLFKVYPVGAKLYQGSYSGNLRFDVRGKTPESSMDEKLQGVQIGPLLKDFMGKDYVTGSANLVAKLSARGLDPMEIRKSLNGSANFSFNNGAVNGLSVSELIHEAYTKEKGWKQPDLGEEQTVFSILSGSATINNGLVTNKDLLAKSSKFTIKGKGNVHLATEKIDSTLNTHIAKDIGSTLKELADTTIPVHITGTFSAPKFKVDVATVLKTKARAAVEAEKAKLKQELEAKRQAEQERLKQQAEEKKQQLQEDLKKKLLDKLKF